MSRWEEFKVWWITFKTKWPNLQIYGRSQRKFCIFLKVVMAIKERQNKHLLREKKKST